MTSVGWLRPFGRGMWRQYHRYILIALLIFTLGFGVGSVIGYVQADKATTASSDTPRTSPVQDETFGDVSLTVDSIFTHNLSIAIVLVVGAGMVGLPTVMLLLYNGFVIGMITAQVAYQIGVAPTVALLFPHGIVELPAIWLSAALTFRALHTGWKLKNGERLGTGLGVQILQSIWGILLVVALLFIAATIEVHITGAFAKALFPALRA